MVILGLLLLGLAAILVIGALFNLDGAEVEYFGYDISPVTLFFVGAVAVALVFLGMMLIGSGTRRGIRRRRERKQLSKLSEKYDRSEEGRAPDADEGS
jgi:hypothetical protein